MNIDFPSLITADATTGLAPAWRIADRVLGQLEEANTKVERPGGTTFLLPPAMPQEVITSVVFYTIAAANHGWAANSSV